MIETIYKGIIIGIIVSAPMGPIGILCVQRTLNRGRMYGLITGVGAMISDLIYASITLIGIGYIDDFLSGNKLLIQAIGSIVIILFGVALFYTNPLRILKPSTNSTDTRYYQDFATAFFLTLSNAFIIFLFISLYARFQYNPLEKDWAIFSISIISIGLGALIWWFFITTYVSKLKKYFNRQSLKFFNRVVGIVFILLGILGTLSATIFNN